MIVIFITTCKRPQWCLNLLEDIKKQGVNHKYMVKVLQDDEGTDYTIVKDFCKNNPQFELKQTAKFYGKSGYWKLNNILYMFAETLEYDYIVQLADDFMLVDNFFNRVTSLLNNTIKVCNFATVNVHRESFKSDKVEVFNGIEYWKSNFADCSFISTKDIMDGLRIEEPVIYNENRGSGVAQKFIDSVNKMGIMIYQTKYSLCEHIGAFESAMHRPERAINLYGNRLKDYNSDHPLLFNLHESDKEYIKDKINNLIKNNRIFNKFNEKAPYVTVIMNCYNEEKQNFIKAAESILANKNVKIQLIVSTVKGDKCVEWCKNYPIELVINEKAGIYEQINATIPIIKGDYVTYSSSNDFMYDYKLYEESKELIANNKKVCYSAFDVNKEGVIKTNKFSNYDYNRHLIGNFVSDCATVEKNLFMRFMPFKLKYGNQAYYDLWLRIYEAEGNVFHYYDRPTWQYIIRDASQHVQRKSNPEKIRINAELKELMLNDRKKNDYNSNIFQLRCSQSVCFFEEMMRDKFNLTKYTDINKPALFFGMYTSTDYKALDSHKGKAIVVWCGGDGKKLHRNLSEAGESFNNARHIVLSDFLKDDLEKCNIKCELLPITPTSLEVNAEPRGDSIYIYIGGHNCEDPYGLNYVSEIEKRTGLNVIVAFKDSYTREQLLKVYKNCFIGLRLTKHDGLPNTVIEMGLMGRRCLYNGGTPNAIKWNDIDDICESIMKEYNNRHIDDVQQVHDAVFDFVNIGTKWMQENPLKIYTLLSTLPFLDTSSGDRINEINTYRCLNQFADVYYNNQKLDFTDKVNFGTNPNAVLEKPGKYDLYYVRANEKVFRSIKGKKIYFCVPNNQECFKQADAIVYITEAWKEAMKDRQNNYLKNVYKDTDYIPNKSIVFNQTTNPKDLKNHSKTLEIKSKFKGFTIGIFGRVVKSDYPHYLLAIIDKLKGCNILCTRSKIFNEQVPGTKKITFIDRIDHFDVPYLASACDCLLYNKNTQSPYAGSLRVTEALSYGIPVFVARFDSLLEKFGSDYELYYDNENELYEKIMYLKNNPDEKIRIGKKLLKRAEKFNLKNSSKYYEKQILQLWEKNEQ